MPLRTTSDGSKKHITIDGKFDYSLQKEFRATYDPINPSIKQYEIDLANVNYMDSASIGMILVMNDKLDGIASIDIINVAPEVKDLLDIANIGKLINIR